MSCVDKQIPVRNVLLTYILKLIGLKVAEFPKLALILGILLSLLI